MKEGVEMRLRRARVGELQELTDLCLRSKAHWGYDEAFLLACRAELTLTQKELRETRVAVLESPQGDRLGVAQISIQGDEAWLEKLFVEPGQLRTGAGTCLYRWCLETARQEGALRLITESDPNAVAFYAKMGATPAGRAPSASVPGRWLPRLVHPLA